MYLNNCLDESPTTCKVFIDEGGLQLYMNILNTFVNDSTVETKVLGLVNNIAEVPHLRPMLFNNDIIPTLRYVKIVFFSDILLIC